MASTTASTWTSGGGGGQAQTFEDDADAQHDDALVWAAGLPGTSWVGGALGQPPGCKLINANLTGDSNFLRGNKQPNTLRSGY